MESTSRAMGEVRSIDTAKEASTDLVALNNVIVNMRSCAKATKVQIMHKLTRTIQKLKKKKGTENEVAKNMKKAQRLLDEVFVIKELNLDKVSKFALQNTTSFDQTSRQSSATVEARCLARLSEHKLLAAKVKAFRDVHSDWQELAAFLYSKQTGRRFKTRKQKMRAAQKGCKSLSGSDSIKENIANFKKTGGSEIDRDRHSQKEGKNAEANVKHSDEKEQLLDKRKPEKERKNREKEQGKSENVRKSDNEMRGKKSCTKRKELSRVSDSDDQEEEDSCEDSDDVSSEIGQKQSGTGSNDSSEEEDSDNNGNEKTVDHILEEHSDESEGEHVSSMMGESGEEQVEDEDSNKEEDSGEEDNNEEDSEEEGGILKGEDSEEEDSAEAEYNSEEEEEGRDMERDDSEEEGDDSEEEGGGLEEENERCKKSSSTMITEKEDEFQKVSETDIVQDPFFICDDKDDIVEKSTHWIPSRSLETIEKEKRRGGHSWQKGHNLEQKGDRIARAPNRDSRWLTGDVDAEDFRQGFRGRGRGGFSRGRGDSSRGARGSSWRDRGSGSDTYRDQSSDSFRGRRGRGSDTFRGKGGHGSDTLRGRGGHGSDTLRGRGGHGSDTLRGRGGRGDRGSDSFRGRGGRGSGSDGFQGKDRNDRGRGNSWKGHGRGGGQGPKEKTDSKKDQGQVDFSHPSWEAKRKRKELEKTASFAGKRIKFDD